MVRPRQFALVLLCGTVTLAGWCAARLGGVEWSDLENTATPIWNRGATRDGTTSSADGEGVGAPLARAMASVAAVVTSHLKLPEPAVASAAVPAAAATVDPAHRETAFVLAGVSAAEAPVVETPLLELPTDAAQNTRATRVPVQGRSGEGGPAAGRAPG